MPISVVFCFSFRGEFYCPAFPVIQFSSWGYNSWCTELFRYDTLPFTLPCPIADNYMTYVIIRVIIASITNFLALLNKNEIKFLWGDQDWSIEKVLKNNWKAKEKLKRNHKEPDARVLNGSHGYNERVLREWGKCSEKVLIKSTYEIKRAWQG